MKRHSILTCAGAAAFFVAASATASFYKVVAVDQGDVGQPPGLTVWQVSALFTDPNDTLSSVGGALSNPFPCFTTPVPVVFSTDDPLGMYQSPGMNDVDLWNPYAGPGDSCATIDLNTGAAFTPEFLASIGGSFGGPQWSAADDGWFLAGGVTVGDDLEVPIARITIRDGFGFSLAGLLGWLNVTSGFGGVTEFEVVVGGPPPLVCQGVPVTPLGQAQLACDVDGNLVISNIGSSGEDGVRMDLEGLGGAAGANGAMIELSPVNLSAADARVEFDLRGYLGNVCDLPQPVGLRNSIPNLPAYVAVADFNAEPILCTTVDLEFLDEAQQIVGTATSPPGDLFVVFDSPTPPVRAFGADDGAAVMEFAQTTPVNLAQGTQETFEGVRRVRIRPSTCAVPPPLVGTSDRRLLAIDVRPTATGTVAVMEMEIGFECPGDFNGDGSIGLADLDRMLSKWGACADCFEDFDENGVVGFFDLTDLLNRWGPCA